MEEDQGGLGAPCTNKVKEISVFFFIQTQVCLFTQSILQDQEGSSGDMGLPGLWLAPHWRLQKSQALPAWVPHSHPWLRHPAHVQGSLAAAAKIQGKNASARGCLAILTPV